MSPVFEDVTLPRNFGTPRSLTGLVGSEEAEEDVVEVMKVEGIVVFGFVAND